MRSRRPIDAALRRWRWIAAGVVTGVLAGLVWSLTNPTTYRAEGSVFFSLEYGNSASDLVQGSTYAQDQVASFARLAVTPVVLQPVINQLDLDPRPAALAGRVQAQAPLNTVMVEVAVSDPSAEQSARITNAVIDSLSEVVEDLAPRNEAGAPTVRATTVAPAEVPAEPAGPDHVLALGVGLLLGLVGGGAAALGRELLDNRVLDAGIVAEVTEVPVVGAIPARTARSEVVSVTEDRHGPTAEAFRHLRTGLQFLNVPADGDDARGSHVFAVTSSRAGEGKSTVSANLAATLAETGARVLLVDADLRRPMLAERLGIEGAAGLTSVLLGRAAVSDVVQDWGPSGLRVLAAGPVPPNPTELLGSQAMRRLLRAVRADFEYVVLDTAPVLPVADAVVLSRLVDGTLVVVNANRARRGELSDTLSALDRVGAQVPGIVLNQVRRDEEAYGYPIREQEAAGQVSAGARLVRTRPAVAPERLGAGVVADRIVRPARRQS
jgi:capsular exopolysaccharide synthesis family protein